MSVLHELTRDLADATVYPTCFPVSVVSIDQGRPGKVQWPGWKSSVARTEII